MDARTINLYIIAVYKVIFFILGTVGNLLFIHLNFKRKQIRCRTSVLQCFQCFFHLFCQFGTIISGVHDIGNLYNRRKCFNMIAFYVFFQAAQGIIMLVVVADMMMLVKFPILYRKITNAKYILLTSTPILLFSIITTLYGFLTTNEDTIYSCSPPFAFGPTSSSVHMYSFLSLAGLVLVFYTILIATFYHKSHDQNSHTASLKTMKRLQITVIIFVFTWLVSQILAAIVVRTAVFSEWSGMALAHSVIFVCLSYSNTFYVTMWRSKEYREQFRSLWWPRKSTVVVHVSSGSFKSSNNSVHLLCHGKVKVSGL